jgi:hypothetical protein
MAQMPRKAGGLPYSCGTAADVTLSLPIGQRWTRRTFRPTAPSVKTCLKPCLGHRWLATVWLRFRYTYSHVDLLGHSVRDAESILVISCVQTRRSHCQLCTGRAVSTAHYCFIARTRPRLHMRYSMRNTIWSRECVTSNAVSALTHFYLGSAASPCVTFRLYCSCEGYPHLTVEATVTRSRSTYQQSPGWRYVSRLPCLNKVVEL